MLSNNTTLAPLNPLAARSTWAMILGAAIAIANAAGVDLLAFTSATGLGENEPAVLATLERVVSALQELLPIAFGFWIWLERRAPFRRLAWRHGA